MTTLHDALGGMRALAQWFVWRLEWDAAAGKYSKVPCCGDASLHGNWMSYDAARAEQQARDMAVCGPSNYAQRYALGFWLTAESGYWFFDLDKCVQPDGTVVQHVAAMVAAFPGALVEWSSSRKGLHVIGRTASAIGAHRSRDIHKLNLEFYTSGRGIAFGLSGEAEGSADTCHDAMVAKLISDYFPARTMSADSDSAGAGPRAEWRGPSDDDELIARAIAARQSAASVFGGRASFIQLWRGKCEHTSENDMALASHLAFWTGCDEDRIVRIMMRSGLVRDKWKEHRTYLRELTVRNAIAGCSAVYQEPLVTTLTVETKSHVTELLAAIDACGSIEEMQNVVVPQIRAASIPEIYSEQLVRAVNTRLDLFGAKLPIGKVRLLLSPPSTAVSVTDAPLWLQQHCYVTEGDFFYNCVNGARLSYQGFVAEYTRLMPMRENGQRENPVEWAFSRWGICTVHRLGYRPDMGPYYVWDSMEYANSYSPASVPTCASEYTATGLAGIDALQKMLWDMCGRREYVYNSLLGWLAHNVQQPGIKIRWSPIIKGTHGDGKSLISNVLRAAMGYRNVGVTGNSTLTNTGGFNDWAVGCAVNIIEEIMLTGKERHRNYNAMNEFVTNDVVNINGKGVRTYMAYNTANHLAFTNYNDALPLAKTDRRWLVVFTPWMDLAEMRSYGGMTEAGWAERTGAIDRAWRECPGELRAWFLGLPIAPEFDLRGSAPMTPEKMRMMSTGAEDIESIAQSIISEGAHGISDKAFSSACLANLLKIRAMTDGFDVPKTTAMNHMLTRLGYSKMSKQVKWRNATHTVWLRNGFEDDTDKVREQLELHAN